MLRGLTGCCDITSGVNGMSVHTRFVIKGLCHKYGALVLFALMLFVPTFVLYLVNVLGLV